LRKCFFGDIHYNLKLAEVAVGRYSLSVTFDTENNISIFVLVHNWELYGLAVMPLPAGKFIYLSGMITMIPIYILCSIHRKNCL